MKSIVQTEKYCFFCGSHRNLEKHHIFGGANRRWSEKYGLTVYLCPHCHRDNREGVHGNPDRMRALHQMGQQAFEKTHNRKEFRDIFGKNYLEDRLMQQERRKREAGEENQKTVLEGFSWLKEEEVGR